MLNSQKTSFAITLMENLVVPTFVLDAEQRVLVWNRACERLTGIPADEVIGTRDHWRAFYDAPRPCLADLVATNDQDSISRLYSTHETPGAPSFGVHAENWCEMPGLKRRLYLAVDAGPVYDDAGHLIAVVETLRDMTEKKLAQAKVQEQASILQAHYEEHQREAELARRILEHQIRIDLMKQAGVDYAVRPAAGFSGDMVLAARSPSGKLYAILADATGHGLSAAVSVLPIVQEFYRLVEMSLPLSDIVESINFLLVNSLPLGRFVSAAFVCVDEAARKGEVWVGGVPDVLMVSTSGEIVRRFPSRHLPLGIRRDARQVGLAKAFQWDTPCRLVMLSDGVAEATDATGKPFEDERVSRAFAQAGAGNLIGSLLAALDTHLGEQAAHDDMSVLVINCPA
ncbi:MAG: SpoIIE family protein phosphatase [Rhodocyclaceae bacterium]|nr:SpoIIE family protein phosphatase [Rhodocyclaceae bacterium]